MKKASFITKEQFYSKYDVKFIPGLNQILVYTKDKGKVVHCLDWNDPDLEKGFDQLFFELNVVNYRPKIH